jgi:2-phosphoglycerate kinase
VTAPAARQWDVLVVGGASGTGKTTACRPLARALDLAVTRVDDLHLTIEAMTTPAQQPTLHYWATHPEARELSPEEIVQLHVSVGRVMAPAVHAVMADHVEFRDPLLLEGDYLLPELLAPEGTRPKHLRRVRAVFVDEPEQRQIEDNLYAREPAGGRQTVRAQVSMLLGRWLRAECERLGVPVVSARPFTSLPDRILAVLD